MPPKAKKTASSAVKRAGTVDLTGEYWYDAETANKWVDWFETFIRHVKGHLAGETLILDDWQRDMIRCLMGWKRKDGTRRYRRLFLYVPRKNGKTLLIAGLALGLLAIDGEKGGEVYVAAATEDQARIMFKICQDIIDLDKKFGDGDLDDIFEVSETSIRHKASNSYLYVLSGLPEGKAGFNASAVIVDEFQEQKDMKLLGVLRTSMAARLQPLIVMLGTAGDDDTRPWHKELKKAKRIAEDPDEDPAYLPIVYETPDEADWQDINVAKKVNPGFGVSVQESYIRDLLSIALDDPVEEKEYRQYHLNQKVKKLSSYVRLDKYDLCGEDFDEDLLTFRGRPLFMGGDLSKSEDMTALGLCWPPWTDDPYWRFMADHFYPEQAVDEKTEEDRVPYRTWADQGLIITTPGDVIDYDAIRDRVRSHHAKKFNLQQVGYDPFNAYEIMTKLADEDGIKTVIVRQGFLTMNAPTKRFRDLVKGRQIRHNNNAILRWNVENATVKKDHIANEMLSKPKDHLKIDGLVACLIALSCAMRAPLPKQSAYADRGVQLL